MLICTTDAVWTCNFELLLGARPCPAGLWGRGGGRASARASRELGWGQSQGNSKPWNVGVWNLATVNNPWNVWDLDSAADNSSWALGFGPCKGQWQFDIVLLTLQRPTTLGHWGLEPAKASGFWLCHSQDPLDIGICHGPRCSCQGADRDPAGEKAAALPVPNPLGAVWA